MAEVRKISESPDAAMDLVFVHGLDGDGSESWMPTDHSHPSWPSWFGGDVDHIDVWSLHYEAWSTRWKGHSMSIQDRSLNALSALRNQGIGERPTCFIAHSMGGLIVKQMLLLTTEPGGNLGNLASATRGVGFLATPHSGSNLASVISALKRAYRATPAVKDLKKELPTLHYMNTRYRDWAATSGIEHRIYTETRKTKGLWIVKPDSADPGIAGARAIPLDADHIDICKPQNATAQVHVDLVGFVRNLVDIEIAGGDHPSAPRRDRGAPTPLSERPYSVMEASSEIDSPDWQLLLDGAALDGNFLESGALGRTADLDGALLDSTDVLEWLNRHSGRTLMLGGERGDGKTSYLNLLAAASTATHVFLRWSGDEKLNLDVVEDLATKSHLGQQRTIVVVREVTATMSDEALAEVAREASRAATRRTTGVVLILEGDEHTIGRIPYYGSHSLRLMPPNQDDSAAWTGLLESAKNSLADTEGERALAQRYPNLASFLSSPRSEQSLVLTDPDSPVIVRLLRAVYGPELWGRLFQEYKSLRPGSPDSLAYVHVCLATLAGRGLSADLEAVLQPHADWRGRSERNPWIFREDGHHWARHFVIAETVLSQIVKASKSRVIQGCANALTVNIRASGCEPLVRDLVLTAAHLRSDDRNPDRAAVANAIFAGTRRGMRGDEHLARFLISRCTGNYERLATWMQVIRVLTPTHSRDSEMVWLIDLHSTLLEAAQRLPNCPIPERFTYYATKGTILRAWHLREDDYETLVEAVYEVSPLAGQPWCGIDFYEDLFDWCYLAISSRRTEQFFDGDAEELMFLYSRLFLAYSHLCRSLNSDELAERTFNLGRLTLRYMHWQLTRPQVCEVLNLAWEYGNSIDVFDWIVGTTLAESLLSSSPPGLAEAREILEDVVQHWPANGQAILLLARVEPPSDTRSEELMGVIQVARTLSDNPLELAYLEHAEAVAKPHSSRSTELTLSALRGYLAHVATERAKSADWAAFAFDRLRSAAEMAVEVLNKVDDPNARLACKQYQRLGDQL